MGFLTDFVARHPTLASQEWPGMRSQWERERCQVHLPQARQGVIVPLTCKVPTICRYSKMVRLGYDGDVLRLA
jgi:hypothetical protein